MSHGKDEDDIQRRHVSVLGDVAILAARQDQVPVPAHFSSG
jgi:hypothetical protein